MHRRGQAANGLTPATCPRRHVLSRLCHLPTGTRDGNIPLLGLAARDQPPKLVCGDIQSLSQTLDVLSRYVLSPAGLERADQRVADLSLLGQSLLGHPLGDPQFLYLLPKCRHLTRAPCRRVQLATGLNIELEPKHDEQQHKRCHADVAASYTCSLFTVSAT